MANDEMVRIGLSFTADTSQARNELEKLKQSLNDSINVASNKKGSLFNFDQDIEQAAKLRGILEQATNSNGIFDLTKFTRGLKESGMTMTQIYTTLHRIGADDTFNKLAGQIQNSTSQVQLLQGTVAKFFDGLKNTAMWTIQSNAIHAVQSALQSAYGYAQQLNKGLTDIAIVSDLNTQQLTEFAKTANQMAKDLNANTKDVVSGALIYYQAGLSDEEVIERTETTIKLAQTSGESAEQISSYMTAIWNNFYDGSKSVEYYADAISYLGAVTAASNADIAEGMQSFSAVADTVGLSFEYGASALTLLRDVTQQSASTIGNSLKTIFARLSSVKQGETLEDGVDYTKYTQALKNIGVDVLKANGELKDMDTILDDLADKWDVLNDTQKAAVAQTVGGVRQYNNLISLMDNYERFQELVSGAQGSDGYLQSQADIYAESWEAAKNRVTAAWQGIYDQIIDDKFFIELTNFGANVINFVHDIIAGMGGLKGLISMIIMVATSIKPDEAALNLEKLVKQVENLTKALTGLAAAENEATKAETARLWAGTLTTGDDASLSDSVDLLIAKINKRNQLMLDGDKFGAAAEDALIQRMAKKLELATQEIAQNKELLSQYEDFEKISATANTLSKQQETYDQFTRLQQNSRKGNNYGFAKRVLKDPEKFGFTEDDFNGLIGLKGGEIDKLGKKFGERFSQAMTDAMAKNAKNLEQAVLSEEITRNWANKLKEVGVSGEDVAKVYSKVAEEAKKNDQTVDEIVDDTEKWQKIIEEVAKDSATVAEKQEKIKGIIQEINSSGKLNPSQPKEASDWSKTIIQITRAMSAMSTFDSAWEGLKASMKDGTATFASVSSSLGSMGYAFMTLNGVLADTEIMMTLFGGMAEASGFTGAIGKFLVGPGGTIALMALFFILKKIFGLLEDYEKNNTLEGKLETTNELLKNQKGVVDSLASSYSNLESTISSVADAYDKLSEVMAEYGPGSPQYALALAEYNKQLDDLIEKYGDVTSGVDENGIRILDSDKLTAAQLSQYNQERFYQQQLEAQRSTYSTQQAADAASLRLEYAKKDTSQLGFDEPEYKEAMAYNSIIDAIKEQLTKSVEEQDWSQITADIANLTDETARNVLNSILTPYLQTANAPATFADIAHGALSSSGIYAAASANNVDTKLIDDALNKYAADIIEQKTEEDAEAAYRNYAATHENAEYKDGILTENGKAISDSELENIVNSYMKGTALSQLMNMSGEEIVAKLKEKLGDEANIPESYWEDVKKQADDAAQYAADLKRATALGLDADEFKEYVDYLKSLNEEWSDNQEIVDNVAIANMRLNQGVASLKDNFKDWNDIIDNALRSNNKWAKNNLEYQQALTGIKKALADIANVDMDQLSDSFVESADNLKLIEAAATGDEDAIDALIKAVAVDLVDGVDNAIGSVNELEQNLINTINSVDLNDIEIGTALDDGPFYAALEAMITSGQYTAEQINAILASIGYSPIQTGEATFDVDTLMGGYNEAHGTYTAHDTEGNTYTLSADTVMNTDMSEGGTITLPVIGAQQLHAAGGKSGSVFTGGTGRNVNPGNKGKGGGKGGGGSKPKTKEKGTNRYHENTEKIGQTKHELEMLNMEEDRAYGQKKLDLIQKKIELLEQEAKQYKALYEEAKGYNEADKNLLASKYGAKFNEDGTIKNFQSWYDSWVDKYNAGAIDDDAWKAFEDAIKKYEESYKKMDEAEKAYQELINKAYDARIEIIEHKLEFLNKEIDETNKHIDFLIKQATKDIYKLADAMILVNEKAGGLLDKAKNYRTAIVEILTEKDNHKKIKTSMIDDLLNGGGADAVKKILDTGEEFTEKELKDLYDYAAELDQINEQLIELREQQYETLNKVIDSFNDKIERQGEIINDTTEFLKHYRNVIDIVGKDILGISDEMLKQLGRTAVEGAKANLAVAKLQLDQNKQILEDMREELERERANGASEEAIRLMEEQIEAQEDKVREMSENWASAWEDALQAATDAFTDAIKIATDAFDKAVAGSMGNLDNLQDMYEKQNTLNDLYLPKYQQIYELNKLTRDVNNAIDNTDNIAGKERLLQLQRDINDAMEEGAQVSEYDVGFMQRRLELEMARIALEEAQNAKNQVRMTRDSEGNWSYTYTADAQKIADAQQNYEDKLYELEKYNQDHIKDMQDMMLNLLAQYRDDIAGLNVTDEERAQMLQEYWEKLQSEYGVFMDTALKDGQFIVDTFGVYDHQLMTDFEDTILSMTSGFGTLEEYLENFLLASQYMMGQTSDAYSDWDGDWHSIFEIAGVDAENFAAEVDEAMADFGETMETAVETAQQFADDLGTEFDEALGHLQDFVDDYDAEITKLIADNMLVTTSIHDLIEEYNKLHAKDDEDKDKDKGTTTTTTPTSPGTGGSGSGSGGTPASTPKHEHSYVKTYGGWTATANYHVRTVTETCACGDKKYSQEAGAHAFGAEYPYGGIYYKKCTICGYTVVTDDGSGKEKEKKPRGCFDAGTKIIMADGSLKNIENIQVGELVIAYNELTKELEVQAVTAFMIHHNTTGMVNIYLENGLILGMTASHPILTTTGWKSLNYEIALEEHEMETEPIEIGQEVVLAVGTSKVTKIEYRKDIENYDTYNITVSEVHTYIANGIIVHNANTAVKMASGGYTGVWGPEGRAAILHEKELVLNKTDTENLLTTVGFVRDLTRMISVNAAGASAGLGNIFSGGLVQGGSFLDQTVTIHAEFPNAVNHTEIEEAFSNLIGLATQYAGRKK